MKRLLLIACFSGLGFGQQNGPVSPARGWWEVEAAETTAEGHIYHLRGHAEMRAADIVFRADQIDYDEDKAMVHLAGHVIIETNSVAIRADDVDYDVNSGEIQPRKGDVRLRLKQVSAKPADSTSSNAWK